jgi:hypothetical protein
MLGEPSVRRISRSSTAASAADDTDVWFRINRAALREYLAQAFGPWTDEFDREEDHANTAKQPWTATPALASLCPRWLGGG